MKKKFKNLFIVLTNSKLLMFAFFFAVVFIAYNQLFHSYFEADEWYAFTLNLPLTSDPLGFLKILVKSNVDAMQHIVPISIETFFLNTLFLGTNFAPYAFISLFLHSINSFLVFLFIKTLLRKKPNANIFAILGGIFFALAPTPMHAVTWAATYQTNVLSVALSLLCIIFFKAAFIKEDKKFIYFSIAFLFLSLFSKETTFFLFFLLPVMAIIEKRIFSLKFLGKVFAISLVVYLIFRFVIPNFNTLPGKIIDKFVEGYIPKSYTQRTKPVDTGTIVSRDISIYKNLPGEILFRTVTFPIKMTGTLFFPRQTVFSIVEFITPIVQPVPPGGDSAQMSQSRLNFLYGPGNGFIIYIASLVILIFCASQIFRFVRRRQIQEAQTLAIGLAIIVFSALPLVAIIFSFPRWGYDFYFDSRYYYTSGVGAAIIFPFLLFSIARFLSKRLRASLNLLVTVLFIIWMINNMYVFGLVLDQFVNRFGADRREVVNQLKNYLPTLPKKTVFYIETDGLSAFGPILPFYTSVPQALMVVYYDRSPLPDSFFNKTLFDGMPQGYSYSQGRGFGYYTSKKDLSEALILRKFELSDVHAFYYKSLKGELLDKTLQVRKEMQDYLGEARENSGWKVFRDPSTNVSFSYPPQTEISKATEKDSQSTAVSFILNNPNFTAKILVFNITPAFSLNDYIQIRNQGKLGIVNSKKVSYDKFHYNDAYVINEGQTVQYLIKFDNKLVQLETQSVNKDLTIIIEKILGSVDFSKQ